MGPDPSGELLEEWGLGDGPAGLERCIDPCLDLTAPNALYLAPGVGHQGATPHDVAEVFSDRPDRVFPSASRSLLSRPDSTRLRDDAQALAEQLKNLLSNGIHHPRSA